MAQPQILQGSWEELALQARAFQKRNDLLLIIPALAKEAPPSAEEIEHDASEQARIAAIHAARGSMTHVKVSVEDLHRERHQEKEIEERQMRDYSA